MSLKKQKCFSQGDKLKIIAAHEAGKPRNEVMREFGLPPSSFYRIIRQKDSIIQQCLQGNGSLRRNRGAGFPDVERCVLEWIHQRFDQRLSVEGSIIKAQAKIFSAKLGIVDFCASNGWLNGFKKRHGLSFNRSQHEELNRMLPSVEGMGVDWAGCFTSLLNECDTNDIYSVVETGLFYNCLPEQIYNYRGMECHNAENGKDRVTVLLCGNVTGTDKLPILVVGKLSPNQCVKEFQALRNAMYESNWNAWITRDIFQTWLKKVDQTMRETERQIVLLVNHSPAHVFLPNLTNIKVICYSAKQGEVQVPHRELIHMFKRNFRTELISLFVGCRKNEIDPIISIPYTVQIAAQAWDTINSSTILNCFMQPHHWADGLCDSAQQYDEQVDVKWPHEADRHIVTQNKLKPNFADYVRVDDNVAVTGMLTDDKIVEMVMNLDQIEGVNPKDGPTERLNAVRKGGKLKNTSAVIQASRQQSPDTVAEFITDKTASNEPVVEQQKRSVIRKEDALEAIKKLHEFFDRNNETDVTTFDMLYELEKCVQSVKK
uniref:HTH CENPB-type domain-containing protein n=1 Tax=Anopheles christyi TaxID=43041 RepID=A0A182JQR2_9DIPT